MKYLSILLLVNFVTSLPSQSPIEQKRQLPEDIFSKDIWLHILSFAPVQLFILEQAYRPKLLINQTIANNIIEAFGKQAQKILSEGPSYDGNKIIFTQEFTEQKIKFFNSLKYFFASSSDATKKFIHRSCTEKVTLHFPYSFIIPANKSRNLVYSKIYFFPQERQLFEEILLLALAVGKENEAIGGLTDIEVLHKLLERFNWNSAKNEQWFTDISSKKYSLKRILD